MLVISIVLDTQVGQISGHFKKYICNFTKSNNSNTNSNILAYY